MAKIIPLKILGEAEKPGYVPYLLTIKNIVSQPSNNQRGVSLDEMRKAVRVLDSLDLLNETNDLILEDADHAFVAEKVSTYIYPFSHKNIIEFITDVVEAKDLKDIEGQDK